MNGNHDDQPFGSTQERGGAPAEIDDLKARLLQLRKQSRLAEERLRDLVLQEATMRETLTGSAKPSR